MEQALAIHRYNDQEIEDMLVQYEEYDDEALLTEIRTFYLAGVLNDVMTELYRQAREKRM